MSKIYLNAALIACVIGLTACAKKTESQDPYEAYNRQAFDFNTTVDKALFKPVAEAYHAVTPNFVSTGITNFFDNLAIPRTFINYILQGKGHFAIVDAARLLVNTTIGIGGFFDVASDMEIPNHRNDFGKTFAYWTGTSKSSYIVLPFMGPSTVRDALAIPFDTVTNPMFYVKDNAISYGAMALDYVNLRANLLSGDPLIYNAFDPYLAMRDAYLQTRNRMVLQNNEMGDYHPGMTLADEQSHNPYGHVSKPPEGEEDFNFDEDSPAAD